MKKTFPKSRHARLFVLVLGALLVTLAVAPIASAVVTTGPVTWVPADSTYGEEATPFVVVPSPAPRGSGATSLGPGAAYGMGFWESCSETYVMGFVGGVPADFDLPDMAQTELAATPLVAGVPLTLAFDKAPGQRVNFVAVVGDPDALVSIEPADPATLTAASRVTVQATVVDTAESYSGDAEAAFGLMVDCSADAARDYGNSLFVTDMHWLDIDPPTFTAAGLAGLTAHGCDGSRATFDGIFTPAFLAAMGILDPAQVQGYIDLTPVSGWSGAEFEVLGEGDGSLWPAGSWKYRVTNDAWCTHSIMFGQLSKPGKPPVAGPKGVVKTRRPVFKWKSARLAARYEVRVYKGAKLLMKKTGLTALKWKASRALPKGVCLTWKVRASNDAGHGVWSAASRFRIR